MVQCASEAIGLANTIRELGHDAHVRIWTDAAGARGMALRSGSGAIKHLETKYFWLQQKKQNCLGLIRSEARSDDKASGWDASDDAVLLVEHQARQRTTKFSTKADLGH